MNTNKQTVNRLLAELETQLAEVNAKVTQLKSMLAPTSTQEARKIKPFSEWEPRAHFSVADVLEVVSLYGQGFSKSEIARRKGCSATFIANILSGRQCSGVTGITTKGGK
jgi:hypothetical protein